MYVKLKNFIGHKKKKVVKLFLFYVLSCLLTVSMNKHSQ